MQLFEFQGGRLCSALEGRPVLHDDDLLRRLAGQERVHRRDHRDLQRDPGAVSGDVGGEGADTERGYDTSPAGGQEVRKIAFFFVKLVRWICWSFLWGTGILTKCAFSSVIFFLTNNSTICNCSFFTCGVVLFCNIIFWRFSYYIHCDSSVHRSWKLITVYENRHKGWAPSFCQRWLQSPVYHISIIIVIITNSMVTASISFRHTSSEKPRKYFFRVKK